jgi:predicted DNA-binding transcriptional regulator AlpA
MEYLSDVELARRFAVSRVTIWRWSSQGILPKPLAIGPNCSRWQAEEIAAAEARWLAAREKRFGKPLPEGEAKEEQPRGAVKQKAPAKPKVKGAPRRVAQEVPRSERVEV